jgi:hypothetical protein
MKGYCGFFRLMSGLTSALSELLGDIQLGILRRNTGSSRRGGRIGRDELHERVRGYSYNSVKIMQNEGQVIVVPYVDHVPPNVGAIKMWLTNRRPNEWSEKQV